MRAEPQLDPTKTVKEVVEEGVQEIVDLLKNLKTLTCVSANHYPMMP